MAEDNRIHVMDEADVHRAIARMAREIVERNGGTDALTLRGIPRRGTDTPLLFGSEIDSASVERVACGPRDITLYRDDLMTIGPAPVVGASDLPQSGIDDRNIVIVDDVLFRGRTARAALDEITDWGRPRRIFLCVLVDRGGRELPIQPDIVGRKVPVMENQRVDVLVPALDGRLGVEIAFLDVESQ